MLNIIKKKCYNIIERRNQLENKNLLGGKEMKILECDFNQFKGWIIKGKKKSKKVIIVLPEYYSDAHEKMKKDIKKYKVLNNTDFILMGFERGFNLEKLSQEIRKLIIKLNIKYDTINVVGHSKAGIVAFELMEILDEIYYDKIINVSVPYKGTPLVEPKEMKKILYDKKILGFKYGKKLYEFYLKSFDGDYADKMICKNSPELRKINFKINKTKFINIVVKSTTIEFIFDILKLNFESSVLYVIDKIMKLDGDGIIPLKSQKIDRIGIPEKIISGTHKTGYRKTIKKFLK